MNWKRWDTSVTIDSKVSLISPWTKRVLSEKKKMPLPQKLTSNFPAAHIQMLSRERFYGLVRQKMSYLATIKKCETFKAKNTILLAKHGGASIMLLGCCAAKGLNTFHKVDRTKKKGGDDYNLDTTGCTTEIQ